MIVKEEALRESSVTEAAKAMMTAARTAPKACGIDHLEICVASGHTVVEVAERMRELGPGLGMDFFIRDAGNIEACGTVVFIGTREGEVRGLDCGLCGSPTCKDKIEEAPEVPCTFAINDLGIALGSAVSAAADRRVDTRIMYSAGVAAEMLGILPGCRPVFAIPISISGKSIFFDRKPK